MLTKESLSNLLHPLPETTRLHFQLLSLLLSWHFLLHLPIDIFVHIAIVLFLVLITTAVVHPVRWEQVDRLVLYWNRIFLWWRFFVWVVVETQGFLLSFDCWRKCWFLGFWVFVAVEYCVLILVYWSAFDALVLEGVLSLYGPAVFENVTGWGRRRCVRSALVGHVEFFLVPQFLQAVFIIVPEVDGIDLALSHIHSNLLGQLLPQELPIRMLLILRQFHRILYHSSIHNFLPP